jgi:hypothetical protein
MPPVAPEVLLLLFLNFSEFHGDGEAVWLGERGTVVVQLAGRASRPKESCVFEWRLPPAGLEKLRARLAGLALTQEKLKDRPGIPDEVRVTYAYRDGEGRWTRLQLWEQDQGANQAALAPLPDIVREFVADSATRKPTACQPLKRGQVRLHRPTQLAPEPTAK